MVLAILLTIYFAALSVLEFKSSVLNSFVLATITVIYLKGAIKRRDSYVLVASLIASCFSILMVLVYLAKGKLSYSILGIATAPILYIKLREYV